MGGAPIGPLAEFGLAQQHGAGLAQPLDRHTLAGTAGRWGFADGLGSAARFGFIDNGLALDSAGNLYASDGTNAVIRKLTPTTDLPPQWQVTTVAGQPVRAGHVDGPAGVAQLLAPAGLAVDAQGLLSVADQGAIRVIQPDGSVSTLAGSATLGRQDGTGAQAAFGQLAGLAMDAAGNRYVVDTSNHRVSVVGPNGKATTLVGVAGYPGTRLGPLPGGLTDPVWVVVDPRTDDIYISQADAILKVAF